MFRLNSYFGTKVVSLERVGGLAIELYRVVFFATIIYDSELIRFVSILGHNTCDSFATIPYDFVVVASE